MDRRSPHNYLIGLIMALLIVPTVVGSSYDRICVSSDCFELWNSPLSQAEKEEAIATMISDAQDWNENLPPASTPPPNTALVSNEYVQNAWIRILAITPSTYENETLLSPGYGTLMLRSKYDIKTPSGTERGDCKTTHSLTHTSIVLTTLNGRAIGEGTTATFNTSQDMTFTSTLAITTKHALQHYRLRQIGKRFVCTYSNTEVRTKILIATDTLNAQIYTNKPTYNLTIQDEYWNTTQFSFKAQNYSHLHLDIASDVYYAHLTSALQPFLTHPPYYALQYRVIPANHTETRNLKINNATFWVHQLGNCTIILTNYFKNRTEPCSIAVKPELSRNTSSEPPQPKWFSEWKAISRIILLFGSGWLFLKFMRYLAEKFDALLHS